MSTESSMLTTSPKCASARCIRDRISGFVCPEGYERAKVPAPSAHRSEIYDYGIKCRNIVSKKLCWFCVCDAACILSSRKGSGIAMSGNSSTNAISHLRERHSVAVRSVPSRQDGVHNKPDQPVSDAVRTESMGRFSAPDGFVMDPVPEDSPGRSIMYTYGQKCTNRLTNETRWFCFCNEICIARSLEGSNGISLKGCTSTNSIAHLRSVHGVTPTLKVGKKRLRQEEDTWEPDAAASATPVNVGRPVACSRLSPLDGVSKVTDTAQCKREYVRDEEEPTVCWNMEFVPPTGYIIDPNIPSPGSRRAKAYDYGFRCIYVATMELRWFCCATEACRRLSSSGIGGISMKGRATSNCAIHLRVAHSIMSVAATAKEGSGSQNLHQSAGFQSPVRDAQCGEEYLPSPSIFEGGGFFQTPQADLCMLYSEDVRTFDGSPSASKKCIDLTPGDCLEAIDSGAAPIRPVPAQVPPTRSLSFG